MTVSSAEPFPSICTRRRYGLGEDGNGSDPLHVVLSPIANRPQRPLERSSILRERILHLGWHSWIHPAVHNAVRLELAQLLRQHLLGDPGDLPAQLRKAPGTLLQPPKDQCLPLAAENIDGRLHGTEKMLTQQL